MSAEATGFRLVETGGPLVIRCAALDAVPGVAHGFSTRRDGPATDFDIGRAVDGGAKAADRAARLLEACGLGGRRPAAPRQVHGQRVLSLDEPDRDIRELEGDAVIGLERDASRGAPSVRTADCLPILLADRDGRAVAAIHAGWRGTAAGIAGEALRALARAGVEPAGLVAALGPAIGPCCYEVGSEVLQAVARATGCTADAVRGRYPGAPRTLDLPEANRLQLIRGGVPESAIHRAPWCTFCENGLFFSYRREGAAAGRMLAAVGWEAPAGLPPASPRFP